MEWCIPIQTFQVENVQIGNITSGPKPLTAFGYKDSDLKFTSLSILLPHLPIKSYSPATGRLIISLAESPQVLSKMLMLQEMILASINSNQQRWFSNMPYIRRINDIRQGFQPMIQDSDMHLYCPVTESELQGPNVYTRSKWARGIIQPGLLTPGTKLRILLKLQGISFHIHQASGQWSGKFRLQHRITAILLP